MKEMKAIFKMPIELVNALAASDKARYFFDTLAPSYRKAYIEWVGGARQETTRKERARKAIMMLESGKKTLTTQLK
ncbi:MAG: hypothetical protein C0408_06505 [Odoribacter sp.]|nr:hypothetical protein [Odoribacter sp.]